MLYNVEQCLSFPKPKRNYFCLWGLAMLDIAQSFEQIETLNINLINLVWWLLKDLKTEISLVWNSITGCISTKL